MSTAWRTLTTFVLDDPDKTVIPGTKTPQRQIHTFPMWYYEGVWFGLTDVLVATNKRVPEGEQDYRTRHERGVWEFYMAPSRDAVSYDFAVAAHPRKALIPRGPAGDNLILQPTGADASRRLAATRGKPPLARVAPS